MEADELDTDSLSLSVGSSATGWNNYGSEPGSPSGSYRTEKKDDDEYVAELTRQMANYMLQDEDKHEKSWGGSGSPQSTLWSPFGFRSGSPSREPSPPLTQAAEKFEKMKAKDEMNPFVIPYPSKQALIDEQIRSAQSNFRKIKEEREKKKKKREQQNRNDALYGNRGRATKSTGYVGNYQRNGSGLKAVFLDGSGSRPGSGGTGVFLPRGTGSDTGSEPRKKTGCPRVIIPARVVEALKFHSEKMGVPSKFTSDFPPHHDALLISMGNNNNNNNGKSSSKLAQRADSGDSHREPPTDLPPEWTY